MSTATAVTRPRAAGPVQGAPVRAARPFVVAVSPHLDDVAFSCGGLIRVLAHAGWRVRVVTVFTGTVWPLSPFALECQLDKGLGDAIDYMALRRGEDDAAMGALGVWDVRRLNLPEAPHRGYTSAPDLFAGVHHDDAIADAVRAALAPAVVGADLVLGPQALGNHVDHRVVATVLDGLDVPLLRYRDTPYALRLPALPAAADEVAVDVDAGLAAKTAACAAYTSQLGFRFGGTDAMADALRDFAAAEARRCGTAGAAEVLRGAADLRALLPLA